MRRLPRLIFGIVLAMALGVIAVQNVDAASINFSNLSGATVEFVGTGNTFSMINVGGGDTDHTGATRDFAVTSTVGGFGTLVGMLGNITGTFTIGPITTVGVGHEVAPVSGVGGFSINDGAGFSFTSSLSWVDIETFAGGIFGAINTSGTLNLSGFSYGGANLDLQALAGHPAAVVVASFQFIPPKSLTVLTTDGEVNSTSYSGTLTATPEPTTMLLGGSGLIALAYAARKRLFGR
jgi:hypothetical protein